MTTEEAFAYIDKHRPQTIHISGKTSTGKSTFSQELKAAFGYEIVELDRTVDVSVLERYKLIDRGQVFAEVYKNRAHMDWINSFVAAAKEKVRRVHDAGHPVIIDGAIANPQTLKELLDQLPPRIILYLHPANIENYYRNLASRFQLSTKDYKAGLPARFWSLVDKTDYEQFLRDRVISPGLKSSIEAYARSSQTQSSERLRVLRTDFENLLVVEV